MGRKRKTRWRRLSIGEISGNEDEGEDLAGTVASLTRSLSSSQNHSPARVHPDKSLHLQNNHNSLNMTKGSSSSLHNSSTNLSNGTSSATLINGGSSSSQGDLTSPKKMLNGEKNGDNNSNSSGSSSGPSSTSGGPRNSSPSGGGPGGGPGYNNGGPNGYGNYPHHPHNNHHYDSPSSHYDRYHYHKDNYRPPSYYNNYERSERGGYQGSGGQNKEYHGTGGSNGGYHQGYQSSSNHYYRNGYNNYRNNHYNNGGSGTANGSSSNNNSGAGTNGAVSTGSEGYNNGGGSDYHNNYPHPPRPYGAGRFRRSRSYPASSYYYANGHGSGGNTDNTNKPSYNHDEYTKITTPRQDVLFKKGYLSQKKSQSSSVESASTTTTPSASNNGTPDTQSTNGINSDYSEGYENGETDCVIPYDDAYYYGPPPPEAVFTDPNTGQVYYGHCSSNGEYYDAYPVSPMMMAGYPTAVYYQVPYPIDWNGVGVPAPIYPAVVAVPPHLAIEDHTDLCSIQGAELSTSGDATQTAKSDTLPIAGESGESESQIANVNCSSSATTSSLSPSDSSSSSSSSSESETNDGKNKDSSSTSTSTVEEKKSKVDSVKTPTTTNNNNNNPSKSGKKAMTKADVSTGKSTKQDSSLSSSSSSSLVPASLPGGTGSSIPPTSTITTSTNSPSTINNHKTSSNASNNNNNYSNNNSSMNNNAAASNASSNVAPATGIVLSNAAPIIHTHNSSMGAIIATTVPLPLPQMPHSVVCSTHQQHQQPQHYHNPHNNLNPHHYSNSVQQQHGPHPLQPLHNQSVMRHHPIQPQHHHGPSAQQMGHGPPQGYLTNGHPVSHPQPITHPMVFGGPNPHHQPPGPSPYHLYPSPPHPSHPGFVYGPPPVYNGIVVPIAPVAASAAASASSSLSTIEIDTVSSSFQSSSRKKRKKRRREKETEGQDHDDDDEFGQLTDENSSNTPSPVPSLTATLLETQDYDENIKIDAKENTQTLTTKEYSPKSKLIENNTNLLSSTKDKKVSKAINTSTLDYHSITPTNQNVLSTIIPLDCKKESLPKKAKGKVNIKRSRVSSLSPPKSPTSSSEVSAEKESSLDIPSSVESSPTKSKGASRKDITDSSFVLPIPPPPIPQQEEKAIPEKKGSDKRESKKSKSKNKKAHKLSAEVGKPKSTMEMTDGDEKGMKNDQSKNSNEKDSTTGSNPEEESTGNNESSSSGSNDNDNSSTCVPVEALPVIQAPSVSNKKPIDLTVQCPPCSEDEMGTNITTIPEIGNAQLSPDILIFPNNFNAPNTEPSSPDSLNTTQSMAGSEIAGVENLSISESEFLMMNRTASIDEVEEDLPQEQLSDMASEASVIISGTIIPVKDLDEEPTCQLQTVRDVSLFPEGRSDEYLTKDEHDPQHVPSLNVSSSTVLPDSETIKGESETVPKLNTEEITQAFEAETATEIHSEESSISVSAPVESNRNVEGEMETQENKETKEEEEKESSLSKHEEPVTDSGQLNLEQPQSSNIVPKELEQEKEKEISPTESSSKSTTADSRPKSITLAVSEWLKTQGDDALTPIFPSRSISLEEDDDIEGDIDEDSDDYYEDEDILSKGSGADSESNPKKSLQQNQKNVYGNPWAKTCMVAPSNKSGSGTTKSRSKGNLVINQQDGIISSRVALSSNAQSQQYNHNKDTNTNQDKALIKHQNYDSGLELSSPESNSFSGGENDSNNSSNKKKILRKSEEREQQGKSLSLNISSVHNDHPDISKKDPTYHNQSSEKSLSIISSPSLDEKDHTEICDPQRFTKYYQFGVVFDQTQDQEGVDTEEESSFLENIPIKENTTTLGESKESSQTKSIQPDFLQVMMKRNKTLRLKIDPQNSNHGGKEVVLRGYCDEDEDEEIGTYDPTIIEQRLNNAVKSFTNRDDGGSSSSTSSFGKINPSSSHHIYVNPISLAKELVNSSNTSGEPLSDSWDVDSEPSLTPYESPTPIEIPVYNHLTPEAKLIRRKLHAVGDPVSSTICCSIQ